MQKFTYAILYFVLFSISIRGFAQKQANSETHWFPMASLDSLMNIEKRPILIDLYTDWCGWCKVMDKKTYANAEVASTIAAKYYAVKLDAEGKYLLRFQGKVYGYDAQYKTHELALYLTKGRLLYPQTIIILPNGSAPILIPGYIEANKMMKLLTQYAGQ